MLKFKTTKRDDLGRESLLSNFPDKSRYAEAYRTLRTNVYFSMMEKDPNSIIITSSLQGEGKTTTTANLAYTIAQTGKSVLIVDADLRKPGMSNRFGLTKAFGFSNLIGDVLGRHVNFGNIVDYGLKDLITLNSLQKRTCVLEINDDVNVCELFFSKGELVDIFWKNRPDEKKLANVLIQENILNKKEAEVALGHQRKSARRLGAVLLALGMVDEQALKKILSIQVMEAYRIVTQMVDGEFSVKSLDDEGLQNKVLSIVDFDQISREMFTSDEQISFIAQKIETNCLPTDEKNLYLLPCGTIPPNPSELLGSPRASYILKLLARKFDVIVVDSSPLMPASDALLLAPQMDGVVLVVELGKANRELVRDAYSQLQKSNANVFGVLLNRANVNDRAYYKYYQSYYGE